MLKLSLVQDSQHRTRSWFDRPGWSAIVSMHATGLRQSGPGAVVTVLQNCGRKKTSWKRGFRFELVLLRTSSYRRIRSIPGVSYIALVSEHHTGLLVGLCGLLVDQMPRPLFIIRALCTRILQEEPDSSEEEDVASERVARRVPPAKSWLDTEMPRPHGSWDCKAQGSGSGVDPGLGS